jgi:hypothetical protein
MYEEALQSQHAS